MIAFLPMAENTKNSKCLLLSLGLEKRKNPYRHVPIDFPAHPHILLFPKPNPPKFYFPVKNHIELMTKNGMLDLERGAKISGFRGYFLKNDAVLLSFALWDFVFKKLIGKGFTPFMAPSIVRPESFVGTGWLPQGEEEVYKNYHYSCFITNLSLSAKMIWDAYRNRADAENRIKELKEDFGADSFNINNFYGTEAALNFVMMAYNLMSLFRQVILRTKIQNQLKTLRYKVFAVGSYLTKDENTKILKLSFVFNSCLLKALVWP